MFQVASERKLPADLETYGKKFGKAPYADTLINGSAGPGNADASHAAKLAAFHSKYVVVLKNSTWEGVRGLGLLAALYTVAARRRRQRQ